MKRATTREHTTLLIDSDIVAFQFAAKAQRTYSFGVAVDELDEVTPKVDEWLQDLKAKLKADDFIICLSCPSVECWRMDVLPSYKGNRDLSTRPVLLDAVKDYLADNYKSYRRPTMEADDIMGILSTDPSLVKGKKIIVSEDKDMQTIPGWLYNPRKDTKPRLITKEQADRYHLYQTIIGDTTDGYVGCPGAGDKAATELLDQPRAWTPYQHVFKSGPRKGLAETRWVLGESCAPWQAVVALYERYGYTEADALVQARVARICRSSDYDFKTKQVILWTPDSAPSPSPTATA